MGDRRDTFRRGVADFAMSMLGCAGFFLSMWGFNRLFVTWLVHLNDGDASNAVLLIEGVKLIVLIVGFMICAISGWFVGNIAGVFVLKGYFPRAMLRTIFVSGGLLARLQARTFDAIFRESA